MAACSKLKVRNFQTKTCKFGKMVNFGFTNLEIMKIFRYLSDNLKFMFHVSCIGCENIHVLASI